MLGVVAGFITILVAVAIVYNLSREDAATPNNLERD